MVKFMVSIASTWSVKIEAVQVDKETEHFVWINGVRRPKSSTGIRYYDTWDQARQALEDNQNMNIARIQAELAEAQSMLDRIKALKG